MLFVLASFRFSVYVLLYSGWAFRCSIKTVLQRRHGDTAAFSVIIWITSFILRHKMADRINTSTPAAAIRRYPFILALFFWYMKIWFCLTRYVCFTPFFHRKKLSPKARYVMVPANCNLFLPIQGPAYSHYLVLCLHSAGISLLERRC